MDKPSDLREDFKHRPSPPRMVTEEDKRRREANLGSSDSIPDPHIGTVSPGKTEEERRQMRTQRRKGHSRG